MGSITSMLTYWEGCPEIHLRTTQSLSHNIWGVLSSGPFTTQEADWTSHSQLLRIIVHYHTVVHV